jgi:hypothetical protein
MASIAELQQELAQANRHIVEVHARLARQREVMRRLEADGHDAPKAKNLLLMIEEGLGAMQAQRQHIVRELSSTPSERG